MHRERGVIHDKNAYLHFKRFIREIISEEQCVEYWHSVRKSPWQDDMIVIHGNKLSEIGRWYTMAPAKKEISSLLNSHGIEHEVHLKGWCEHITIPIDQEACPKPGRRKALTAKNYFAVSK
jgi:hypothetical protein